MENLHLYEVCVVKRMYSVGSIEVFAPSEEKAQDFVEGLVANSKLTIKDIKNWGGSQIEIDSFATTGDIKKI